MKKLLFILTLFFFSIAVNAQPTDVIPASGATYGNFRDFENNAKIIPGNGEITIMGLVINRGELHCVYNKCTVTSITIQREDGTTLVIGTSDHNFSVPRYIVGKKIRVEGIDIRKGEPVRRNPRTENQKDIQFAATGVKVI